MSCHSTPANVAVLGFYAQTMKLPSRAVENEFHWLKKMGRDRSVAAPTLEEWNDFLIQRERWVKHDSVLTAHRKETTLERLANSYEQVPDGPTYYALNNLPVRLNQVTAPSCIHDALNKVSARAERLEEGSHGKDSQHALSVMAEAVWEAAGDLGSDLLRRSGNSPHEDIPRGLEEIRRLDMKEVTPAQIYSGHEKLLKSLRATRRPQKTS